MILNQSDNKSFNQIAESIKQTEFKINLTDGTIQPTINASNQNTSISFDVSTNTLETSNYMKISQDNKLGTIQTISPNSSSVGLSIKNKNDIEKSSGMELIQKDQLWIGNSFLIIKKNILLW